MTEVYVEFDGGTRNPGGYIVPAEELKSIPGWSFVRLRPASPNESLSWTQWVRLSQIVPDDELE
jgi:hypothetical protein